MSRKPEWRHGPHPEFSLHGTSAQAAIQIANEMLQGHVPFDDRVWFDGLDDLIRMTLDAVPGLLRFWAECETKFGNEALLRFNEVVLEGSGCRAIEVIPSPDRDFPETSSCRFG